MFAIAGGIVLAFFAAVAIATVIGAVWLCVEVLSGARHRFIGRRS